MIGLEPVCAMFDVLQAECLSLIGCRCSLLQLCSGWRWDDRYRETRGAANLWNDCCLVDGDRRRTVASLGGVGMTLPVLALALILGSLMLAAILGVIGDMLE